MMPFEELSLNMLCSFRRARRLISVRGLSMYRSSRFLLVILLVMAGCGKKEDPVKIVTIEGVRHILNPAVPLKGTVELQVEKVREINPYEIKDVGMRAYGSARNEDGELLLFDLNSGESHHFGKDGRYLGRLIRQGQGPGEFPPYCGLILHFIGDDIWATSLLKISRFDRGGRFLDETKFESAVHPKFLVDESRCLGEKSEWSEKGEKKSVVLINFKNPGAKEEVVFYEATREWLVRKGQSAFSDSWATPALHCAYCPLTRRIYTALNLEYKISVADLTGKSLGVIERPAEPVRVSAKDKEVMADWALKGDSSRWILDAYPDTLAPLFDISALPKGYLAALRVTGPKRVEIDVFDPEGRYVYALRLPEGVRLERHHFTSFGFATQETQGDYPVYREYRIKNLPAVFE
jgi:hypothetical protein